MSPNAAALARFSGSLKGRTLFISGASRGIGKAIALRAAKDGANIIIAAKTATQHSKLAGTIYTAAHEIEKAGGKCLPCIVDVREEEQVRKAVEDGVKAFGGIDICVNNASAISLTGTLETDMKKFDLMMNINTRGTFVTSKACLPYLVKSSNPHILNLSPPLNLNPRWFKDHTAYSIAKYGMSLCVLGMAAEFKDKGVAVNALWPKTAIYTAAMDMLAGAEVKKSCRTEDIVSDAAHVILSQPSRSFTGRFTVDEDVLRSVGVKDFDVYSCVPGSELMPDFFLDDHTESSSSVTETTSSAPASPTSTASSSSAAASSEAPLTELDKKVEQVIKQAQKAITPTMLSEVRGYFQVELKGDDINHRQYYLDLLTPPGATGRGKGASAPADPVIMSCTVPDFLMLFNGELSPTRAFMTGRLKISGSMGKAQRLIKFIPQFNVK
eukprot:TRINITY_DN5841_c0_g1_i1.p1 TRINITY_DN5841_c0_g1~~TRINITY_DN5841_c0_g1_i1.p1  ORF type:complete len:451 (+),score=131.62 TRINITY_DN5841_c0_g1_i1:36-1355(+)